MNERAKRISRLASGLVVVALVVTGAMLVGTATAPPVKAWETLPPCDFLTGGGWIVYNGNKANFGVAGGCKHGSPTWGHLEYIDHGTGLNVHWTSITGYFFVDDGTGTDPQTGQPTGTRGICGTARTNLYGDVNFAVRAKDAGEPGVNDQFDIRLTDSTGNVVYYDTTSECLHYLGSSSSFISPIRQPQGASVVRVPRTLRSSPSRECPDCSHGSWTCTSAQLR
ncbi:MAG: hypothetical protein DMG47_06455 [Acidobacteria bacterium]|nr:MAG: hypothetical protein AUH16_05170 [Acidobacteria bacterium 13_2_20CM_57_7]PYT45962.1 MAG: hypothetical protein DMG47_06455 [Acidobacteriota bacterium]